MLIGFPPCHRGELAPCKGVPMFAVRLLSHQLARTVSAIALLGAAPALAQTTYTAVDDNSLRNDITTANGDGAASSIITLGNNVTLASTSLPVATKALTLDSASFAFLKAYSTGTVNQGVVAFNGATTAPVTFKGTITGVNGGGNTAGQYALYLNNQAVVINDAIATSADGSGTGAGGIGVTIQNAASLTNNGTITAGSSTGGSGGGGAFMAGAILTNNGTLTGGSGTTGGYGVSATIGTASTIINNGILSAGGSSTGAGGVGAMLSAGSSLTNSSGAALSGGNGVNGGIGVTATGTTLVTVTNEGTIRGGNATTGTGGDGVRFSPGSRILTNAGTILGGSGTIGGAGVNFAATVAGTGTLVNSGTIQGGNGSTTSGVGISAHTGLNSITNSGTIAGGTGVAAILQVTGDLNIVNSGAITAGAGNSTALLMQNSNLTLEMDAGSVITGNVVGVAGQTNTLTLGGAANASFDVSTVGPQYQNFTVFNKAGISTWSLTGTATQATPWTISSGTLQLGDGTTDGSILGDVTDNATFAFNNKSIVTYAGAISGAGTVTQVGTGTTVLTGTNSYTGGTTIASGTLQVGNGGTAGNIPGDVTDNGTLAFDRSDAVQYAGTISGSGGVRVLAGNFVLTGTNTYTGGTNIAAGATLQLGIPTANGSITGNVTDNGTLAFNNGSDQTFGGVIGGSGQVTKAATGNTTLTGTNTYSGGTIITFGTVTGAATSFGTGAITDNATLVINQPADAAFANAINGSGSFTKTGTGRLNYTGTGTLTGPTTVAGGLLSVNGSLAASAVTVASGATLGGNGTVGATTIQSGGTIAPGNSIGTLHINGAFVQNAGSTYQVEVDPTNSAADLIAVNGTATIQSGAGLNVTQNPAGQYQVGTVYKVLTASGGVSGTYAPSGQTTSASAFLGLKDSYDSNNVYLTVVQTRDPATAATTPNQVATATGVNSLPVTSSVPTAVLNNSSDAGARAAFDQLSGQVQASAQGALLANGLYVRDVAFGRMRDMVCVPGATRARSCNGASLSIWAQGFGGWGGIAGNGNAMGLNHTMAGALMGVDVPVANWRLGVFGGFDHADFHVADNSAAGGSNDYHLGIYGGTVLADLAVRLGASYSFNDIHTDRAVAIGSFSDNLRGLYNGGTVQAFGEVGYGIDLGDMALEPVANLAYTSLRTSGFTEAGGPAALMVKSNSIDNTTTTLGVRPSTTVTLGDIGATLRGMMGWRHTFGQVTPDAQVAFAGGSSFSVSGAPIARDAGAVEAGADLHILEDVTFGITYAGQFSGRTTDQTAWGTVRVSF